jgi:hypothetical protein
MAQQGRPPLTRVAFGTVLCQQEHLSPPPNLRDKGALEPQSLGRGEQLKSQARAARCMQD